ncbi:hypothetical protein ZIOFF_067350 [Zingiber officinale]|uniref:Uncharacterized protein n=1 Tax=Zingiber officinale TaxID=94328 RepID=A0A8J5EDX7_ZINOF|nr:hypothetical protein ZIOFF_067350 [Zingiber officinale]
MDEKSSGISMNHETLELSDIEENSMLIMRLLHLNTQNHQDGNQDQGKIIFQIRHPNGCQKKGLQSIIIETAMLKKVRDQDRFDCQSSICNQLEDYSEKVRYHVSVSRLGKQINQNMQCICPGFGKGESGCQQHIGLESVSDVCSANHPTSFGKLATMMSCDPHVCQDNVDNFHIDTDVDCQDKLGLLIMKEYYSKNNIEDNFNHAKITSDPARSSSSSDNCFSCHNASQQSCGRDSSTPNSDSFQRLLDGFPDNKGKTNGDDSLASSVAGANHTMNLPYLPSPALGYHTWDINLWPQVSFSVDANKEFLFPTANRMDVMRSHFQIDKCHQNLLQKTALVNIVPSQTINIHPSLFHYGGPVDGNTVGFNAKPHSLKDEITGQSPT